MNDEQAELARQNLRAMFAAAKSRKELAWQEIQTGCNPDYVAMKYGLPVDEMRRARNIHLEGQEKAKGHAKRRANAYQEP